MWTTNGHGTFCAQQPAERNDMAVLSLPGFEAETPFDIRWPPLAIVAGGRPPAASWLKKFLHGKEFWCADSGLVPCINAGFFPSRVIGDGDSSPGDILKLAQKKGALIEKYPPDKDYTDLQLALFRAGEEGYGSVLVSGCWGGRFDHLWSVVHSAVWAHERGTRVLAFADHGEVLFLLHGGEEWRISVTRRKGAVLSLLPLAGDCRGVSISGTRWSLENIPLLQAHPFSVSNRLLEKENPRISVSEGILGVYFGWEKKRAFKLPA